MALEAAAVGCSVVVCDARGFAGLLDTANMEAWRRMNLGVGLLTRPTTVENLMLRVHGEVAWALFDQRYPGVVTPFNIISRGLTHEMRVFEKHDGRWKIAFLGYLDEDASLPGRMMVLLDQEGRILWQTVAATQF